MQKRCLVCNVFCHSTVDSMEQLNNRILQDLFRGIFLNRELLLHLNSLAMLCFLLLFECTVETTRSNYFKAVDWLVYISLPD